MLAASLIHCTVMDKSSRTTYNRTKVMATVVLADSSHIIKAQVYDMDSLDLMILNGGLQIKDFIPKSNRYVHLLTYSHHVRFMFFKSIYY